MGKGDKKSKRGKIYSGTFGVRRPRKAKNISIFSGPSVTPEEAKAKKASEAKPAKAVKSEAAKETKVEAKAEAKPKKTAKKETKE